MFEKFTRHLSGKENDGVKTGETTPPVLFPSTKLGQRFKLRPGPRGLEPRDGLFDRGGVGHLADPPFAM